METWSSWWLNSSDNLCERKASGRNTRRKNVQFSGILDPPITCDVKTYISITYEYMYWHIWRKMLERSHRLLPRSLRGKACPRCHETV